MDVGMAFRDAFGAPPEGVWSAPGRVNLIGEHTDYNGGLALPIALPQRTYAAASRRPDRRLRIVSRQADQPVEVDLDQVAPGRVGGWAAYVAGVPWALERAGFPVGGLDLAIDGRVPLGAGLSSSAALECAVAAAYSDLFGLDLLGTDSVRAQLVSVCRSAENDIAGAPTGGMDQSASLLCRAGHALLLDCRDGSTEHVPFDLAGAGLELLVVDTRTHHELVDGQYGARRSACEQAAVVLGVDTLREVDIDGLDDALDRLPGEEMRRRVRHVVTEIDRVTQAREALTDNDFPRLGGLFDASHESLRADYEVSCAELDTAVDSARAAGALGARMTGGGFGGSAIALVRAGDRDDVATAVRDGFAGKGFREPHCFAVTPAAGAGREG